MKNSIVEDLLEKLKQCDDFHNRCDYLLEHDETTYLLDYITNLQKTNKNHSKKLIELGDKITNLQQENKRLKETNVYCNRTDCIGRIKDSRKYDSVYQEKEDYKSRCEKASELIDLKITRLYHEVDYNLGIEDLKDIDSILQNGSDSQ